ncbi:hypothetical protein AB0F72_17390 [Actinoplanes sp. NPDC023936]|uniref:hypothetical protein n=1 Tax=Actinoplanes sp. NPDC023936 TaxID=3154910 RepID=UPI00340C8D2C
MRYHLYDYWPIYALLAAVAVFIALAAPAAARDQERWESWCREQGGTISSRTGTVSIPYSTGNGGSSSYTETTTTYTCTGPDGRVLDTN